jgi:hypothetical protein
MAVEFLLGANKRIDTGVQVLKENQIVVRHGAGCMYTQFVVYRVEYRIDRYLYHLINVETKEFTVEDLIRPLHEKFGIGMYYNALEPEFMDAFEVLMLKSEAETKAQADNKAEQTEQERREQLKAVGRERLKKLIPADAEAMIIAEFHIDESDGMTDYFGYRKDRIVILGFSNHTKDVFAEMRKYAANFEGTAYLAQDNKEYEHREKYSGGAGYYLGKSKYSGWIIKKEKFYLYTNREYCIERYALTASDEANICVKVQTRKAEAPETVTGDFIVVDYSEKALAVFGDTRPIKDQLKAIGGKFNPKLTHDDEKKAGWIFSKSKEQEVIKLLNIK